MKNTCKLIYILLPLLMTSCIKDGYDKENCPGEFIISSIYPDLFGKGNDNEIKNARCTLIGPDGKETTMEIGSDKRVDLDEGTYTLVVLQNGEAGNAFVKRTSIEVSTLPDGRANDAGDDVIGGYTQIEVGPNTGANGTPTFVVPTNIQTRPLVINVAFEGMNAAFIETVQGLVDGIAIARDLNNGFAPTDGKPRHPATKTGSISYAFDKNASGENLYSDKRTLLGIDGNSPQTLTITVNYTGGTKKDYTFDISRDMDEFHVTKVMEPWVINITLRLGADFKATIVDWEVGAGLEMDAH